MSTREAAIALRRFGLGSRPGEVARIAADPRGFVLGQLAKPTSALLSDLDLEPSHLVFAEAQRAQIDQRATKDAAKQAEQKAMAAAAAATANQPAAPGASKAAQPAAPAAPQPPLAVGPPQPGVLKANAIRRDAFVDELSARIDRAITTENSFLERLVLFWSGHFCVSATKGQVRGLAGGYEREAIRPHVLGRFADMLKASAQHPAMLIYLDNQQSVGPNSQAGKNRGVGLNENLAREILELHTLGVDGGYTQDDVTNFARILTGWTVGNVNQPNFEAGKFAFTPARHEPGAWNVVGKRYEDKGRAAGEDVLADTARHPSTARHIARKLARHFLADDAPQALIDRIAATFTKSDGNLADVTRTLVEAPEMWASRPRKVVPPFDFTISIARGFGVRPKAVEIARIAAALGQPTWQVLSPKGWPDEDDAWMGPSAVRERLRIAEMLARQMDKLTDPRALAVDLLGEQMREETRQSIARAESREQGFEILVMAPEFLRR